MSPLLVRPSHARSKACFIGLALLASVLSPAVCAAQGSVPYVPTPQVVVERMLEIAKVGARDYVIDLGSGDGRIVVTAASKYGARGFGVDLNPTRIEEANANARKAGVANRVAFYRQDLFTTDLAQATVITMYLLPRVNLELRPKLLDLRPGTRIVSHDFAMDDWKPDHHEEIEAKDKYGGTGGRSDIYLWYVPAKVAGRWQSQLQVGGKPANYEIALEQRFQAITGLVNVGGRSVPIRSGKVSGESVTFEFSAEVNGMPVKHQFSGTVGESGINGTADLSAPRLQSRLEWSATRAPARAAEATAPAVAALF